jgi:hypothetical protein
VEDCDRRPTHRDGLLRDKHVALKHATDLQQVPLHFISHNVFRVDLTAIETHVLVVPQDGGRE